MKKTRLQRLRATFIGACALAFVSGAAFAQSAAPPTGPEPAASGASAPSPASRPTVGPRLRSPVETGNRAAAPGDLRPERPVAPQISIPFGKNVPPADSGTPRVVRRPNAPASGGIDDSAARCEAQADDQLRAACRAKLATESKGRLPN